MPLLKNQLSVICPWHEETAIWLRDGDVPGGDLVDALPGYSLSTWRYLRVTTLLESPTLSIQDTAYEDMLNGLSAPQTLQFHDCATERKTATSNSTEQRYSNVEIAT